VLVVVIVIKWNLVFYLDSIYYINKGVLKEVTTFAERV